jgi:hypothetical protein
MITVTNKMDEILERKFLKRLPICRFSPDCAYHAWLALNRPLIPLGSHTTWKVNNFLPQIEDILRELNFELDNQMKENQKQLKALEKALIYLIPAKDFEKVKAVIGAHLKK